jgi:pimeloyl-ACP methyl ester carboxylesterase
MSDIRVCLIHGAATTATSWLSTAEEIATVLPNARIERPLRGSTGSLDAEVETLVPYCVDALVVGVSGGATLGLELAARGVDFRAAILHEPAAGSLLPSLLDAVVAAYQNGGVPEFAAALYGPAWNLSLAPEDPDAVGRDLAMFRGFEPRPAAEQSGPVLLTVGARSPEVRHEAARRLAEFLGFPVRTIAEAGHAVHLEQPRRLAELIAEVSRELA